MTRIILMPHGATVDPDSAMGHHDSALSPLGERQSRDLAAALRAEGIEAAFASDLQRARRAAELALDGTRIAVVPDIRLRGVDYGTFTMRPKEEIQATRLDYLERPYPGGESYADVLSRYGTFLDMLRVGRARTVLVCAHGPFPFEVLLLGRSLREAVERPATQGPIRFFESG